MPNLRDDHLPSIGHITPVYPIKNLNCQEKQVKISKNSILYFFWKTRQFHLKKAYHDQIQSIFVIFREFKMKSCFFFGILRLF
jgi:hypothetical protein